LPSNVNFDYLEKHSSESYPISFRVVRFKLTDETYETIITNLNNLEFPPISLKKIYQMRWGIETSFRELKYTIGLLNFHAKKAEYIMQEIYAKLIMYNLSMIITMNITFQQKDTKYQYQGVSSTIPIFLSNISRKFLAIFAPLHLRRLFYM